jgi:tetratricopeptide (TPR) repeat protein
LPKDLDWPDPFVTGYMRWARTKRNRYRLADQFEAAGRYAEMADVFRPMTRQYPDDYLPHLMLGKALGRIGDYPGAEASLRKARRLAPDKVQGHYYLSLILFMHGDQLSAQKGADPARAQALFRESAESAGRALAITPDYGFAHMTRGLALRRLRQRAEGLAALRNAVSCNPEQGELHFYLGQALAQDGQAPEARARLEHALRLAEAQALWLPGARALLNSLPGDGK